MARLIQVANLADSVDSISLERLFALHGGVRTARISTHVDSGRSTGVGFIEMESDVGGAAAIAAMNNQEFYGQVLSVCWVESSENWVADRRQMFGPMNMMSDEMT